MGRVNNARPLYWGQTTRIGPLAPSAALVRDRLDLDDRMYLPQTACLAVLVLGRLASSPAGIRRALVVKVVEQLPRYDHFGRRGDPSVCPRGRLPKQLRD